MIKSLLSRFIIFILSFTVATSFLSDALIKYQIEELTVEYLQYESKLVSESLDIALIPLIEIKDMESIQSILMNVGNNPTIENIHLMNSVNKIVASTDLEIVNQLFTEDVSKEGAYKEGIFKTNIPVNISDTSLSGSYDLIIQLSASYGDIMAKLISKQIMYIYFGMQLVMIIGITLIFLRLISAPIGRLNIAASEIKHSNYKIRIKRESDDEIGQLAKTFNEMTESIEEHTEALKNERIKAEISAEAKMRFIANTSHEIRTPLNTILGFSDILSENETDVEKIAHLDIIKSSGDHLLKIINDILDISKLENNGLQLEEVPFTIRSEVYDITKMFEMEILRKNLKFSAEVNNKVPRVLFGDVLRIKQTIINIINNAVKFTEKGKVIVIINYQEGMLTVDIKDTGIGISKENQEKIFDTFTQADHSTTRLYGGTGLGLAICEKIVENMNGNIVLESEIGKGTSISIKIPMKESNQQILVVFNGEKMVKNWLGSDTLVSDLVLSAIKELPDRIDKLSNCLIDKKITKLYNEAHIIKGLSGNFHMQEIYEPSAQICKLIKETTSEPDLVLLKNYITELEKIVKEIPEYYFDKTNNHIVDEELSFTETNARVLVAEDVFENWLLIKYILKSMPINLEHAENGIRALTMLENNDYDLLLLDMQMPYIGGKEIIEIIRKNEKLKNLKVIIVTANATKNETDEYLSLGCDFVIPKPINKDKLREKVIELIKN